MSARGDAELGKDESVIISLMEKIEEDKKDRDGFRRAWHDALLDRMNREPEGDRREQMVADFELFDRLFGEHFENKKPLTESVGTTPEEKWANHVHKETNAVAVYVIEGIGYDQFGDRVKVQLTRREIHEMDITTTNGAALFEGVVQLNRKPVTDTMAKAQHIDVSQAYAFTQLVPVLKRKPSDA